MLLPTKAWQHMLFTPVTCILLPAYEQCKACVYNKHKTIRTIVTELDVSAEIVAKCGGITGVI